MYDVTNELQNRGKRKLRRQRKNSGDGERERGENGTGKRKMRRGEGRESERAGSIVEDVRSGKQNREQDNEREKKKN